MTTAEHFMIFYATCSNIFRQTHLQLIRLENFIWNTSGSGWRYSASFSSRFLAPSCCILSWQVYHHHPPSNQQQSGVFKKMHPRSIYLHWFRTLFSFLRLPQNWGISPFLTKPSFEKCSLPLGLPSLPPSAEARRCERHSGRNSACSDR